MATINIAQARLLGNKFGLGSPLKGGPERPNIKETASQTYFQGDPVYYDSNGTIALVTVSSSLLTSVLAGFAEAAATGVTGTAVRYRPVMPGDLYVMNLKGASTTTTALTQVGTICNFNLVAATVGSGNCLCATVDTQTKDGSKAYGVIEGLYTIVGGYNDGDVVGDTNGRVIVRIIDSPGCQG